MNCKKYFTLLVTVVVLLSTMPLGQVVAQDVEITGVVSTNARYRIGGYSASKTGDFVLDVVRLNFNKETDRYKVYASVRNYAESFGGLTIPEAYFQYKTNAGNFTIGSMRQPVYEDVWFSNAWYSNMDYYLGIGDKFMMGVQWDKHLGSKFNMSVGFYKNPTTSITWNNDALEKDRYSNDVNRAFVTNLLETSDELTAREENQFGVGFTYKPSRYFHVRSFTRLGGIHAYDGDRDSYYTDLMSTLSITVNLSSSFQIGTSLSYYNSDLTDIGDLQRVGTVSFGYDYFGLDRNVKGRSMSVKIQKGFATHFRAYAEYSGQFDEGVNYSALNRDMKLVGLNYYAPYGLSMSLEYLSGKRHPWIQNLEDGGHLVNLNMSYYF